MANRAWHGMFAQMHPNLQIFIGMPSTVAEYLVTYSKSHNDLVHFMPLVIRYNSVITKIAMITY